MGMNRTRLQDQRDAIEFQREKDARLEQDGMSIKMALIVIDAVLADGFPIVDWVKHDQREFLEAYRVLNLYVRERLNR